MVVGEEYTELEYFPSIELFDVQGYLMNWRGGCLVIRSDRKICSGCPPASHRRG